MTLRQYTEAMGLRIVSEPVPDGGVRCHIEGFQMDDSCRRPEMSAAGADEAHARENLVRFISGRILRSLTRSTTLYWVPANLKP